MIKRNSRTNHIFFVLDASGSMGHHADAVVKVTDRLVADLASQVKTFPDQETRVSLYQFSYACRNLVWDTDVLRFPSISGEYRPAGGTALADAMMQAITDAKTIPVKYGDHAVLIYLVTDGLENSSTYQGKYSLPLHMSSLPDTWTAAALIPSVHSRTWLTSFGFAPGNITVWDPSSSDGMEQAGEKIATATAGYMTSRSQGVRSTANLFTMNAPPAAEVKKALVPMTEGSYFFEPVTPEDLAKVERGRIDQFMMLKTGRYDPGMAYYQMDRRVRISRDKKLAIADAEGRVYTGGNIRNILGLPADKDVRVSPGRWKDGTRVYVQSNSMNRRLYPDTNVLIMR